MTRHTLPALALLVLPLTALGLARSTAGPAEFLQWEYKVVGLSDIHGTTLDYLKEAFEGGDGDESILDFAARTERQMLKKTEDLLNTMGEDGWELLETGSTSMTFKRVRQ